MKRTLLDGNGAAAWAVRLCDVDVVPNFPITPQTEIIETLAKWKADGEWDGEFLEMEGEHSVMSAAIGSEAAGVRTFTASSSQGTLYMHEMMYIAAGMRLPIVMVNAARGLSAPITLWPDQNDILAMRDTGWLIFFCQNNQEVLDSIIQAYRICEDRDVLLPALINMEGFIHSYTREPVEIPDKGKVKRFLPRYKPKVFLDPKKPMCLGAAVMDEYTAFKSQVHRAQMNAKKLVEDVGKKFGKNFGRRYGLLEEYKLDDADTVFISTGSLSTTVKQTIDELRKEGKKPGLLRIRTFRPFPEKEIRTALADKDKIGVLDNDVAPGFGGIIYSEVRSALYGTDKRISNYILSLGGRHVGVKDFKAIHKKIEKGSEKRYWLGL